MFTIRFIVFALFFNLNKSVYSESILDLSLNGFNFITAIDDVSQNCQDQLNNLNMSTLLTMFDASAKLPDGLLIPLTYHLGQFDECYDIDDQSEIYGKYCLGTTTIEALYSLLPNLLQMNDDGSAQPKPSLRSPSNENLLHFGYCLSDGCTADDFHQLFKWLDFDEEYCYSQPTTPELSTGAIITIAVLAFFLALVVLSTMFDVYLFYTEKKTPHQLLIAFSVFTNGKNLIKSSNNPNQLLCLDGLRSISMVCVVLFHVYTNIIKTGPYTNSADFKDWLHNPFNTVINQGSIAVDTFFAIGGILVVYTFLKSMERSNNFNIGLYYLHRYLRLTPLLAIWVLIHAELVEYLGNGPLWTSVKYELVNPCKTHWWLALLYLQNYVQGDRTCVRQSWYLSVDFQLYLLSPIVLLVVRKSRKYGMYMLYGLIVLGFISPTLSAYFYGLHQSFFSHASNGILYFFKFYNQTYVRFGPYVIGMLAGYHIYDLKKSGKKIELSTLSVLALWCVALGTLVACIIGPYDIIDREEFQWYEAVANGFVRNAWAIGICILVFLCLTGYGGPINWVLSLPVFQLLSKLSYTIYLTHYQVIVVRYGQSKQPIFLNNRNMMWSFWGDFSLSVAIGVLFYFMFEPPMGIIEKQLLAPF